MFQFLTTYRKIVIVLLTIVLAIPCSVKRDLKQQFNIESNQSAKNNSAKIGCASFCSSYINSNKKQKQKKKKKNVPPFSFIQKDRIVAHLIFPILDQYHFFKEKIPTHIRNQQFLI